MSVVGQGIRVNDGIEMDCKEAAGYEERSRCSCRDSVVRDVEIFMAQYPETSR